MGLAVYVFQSCRSAAFSAFTMKHTQILSLLSLIFATLAFAFPGDANAQTDGELIQGGGGGGLVELPRWRKASAVSRQFTAPYLKAYWHLCEAKAFVPAGSVCDIGPLAVPVDFKLEGNTAHFP